MENVLKPFECDCDGATEKLFARRLCKGGVGDGWWSDVIISAPSPDTFLPPTPTELLLLLLLLREGFCSAPLLRDIPEPPDGRCDAPDELDWLFVLIVLSMIIPSTQIIGWKIPKDKQSSCVKPSSRACSFAWCASATHLRTRRLDLQLPSLPWERSEAASRDTDVDVVQWSRREEEYTA